MNISKETVKFLILVICLGIAGLANAQTDNDYIEQSTEQDTVSGVFADDMSEDQEQEEEDEEAVVLEAESEDAQIVVDNIFAFVDVVNDYIQQDTLVQRWAMYSDIGEIVPYIASKERDILLVKRFDVIRVPSEAGDGFVYVKEYVFNENQAWDYIYERIYDAEGKLAFFERHYNTYNSGCAEVALEESQYFYNKSGVMVKKTYNIYDSQDNPLSIEDCYMDREDYEKYMSLQEFMQINPIPVE